MKLKNCPIFRRIVDATPTIAYTVRCKMFNDPLRDIQMQRNPRTISIIRRRRQPT